MFYCWDRVSRCRSSIISSRWAYCCDCLSSSLCTSSLASCAFNS